MNFLRLPGDPANLQETSQRSSLQASEIGLQTAGDVAATEKTSRRRRRDCWRHRGDVPAASGRIGCHLWRRLQDVALVRAQAIFWSSESLRLISRYE